MFNDIHIGPVTIHMYGLMIAIAFMSALFLCLRRGKKKGLDEDTIYGIFYCALLGAVVGCRLLFYIVEFPNILKDPSILWNFREGYVVYGGILGGILFGYFYLTKIKKACFWDYFDLVMPSVAFAQGVGRIGCLFAGCCYGARTDSRFHIVFHHSDYAPNNVPLIPTQLISSVGDFIFAALLLWYERKNPCKGRVSAAYLCLYGVGRFIIEFFRNDYRGNIGFLSTSQIISIGIVIAGILIYFLAPGFRSNRDAAKN